MTKAVYIMKGAQNLSTGDITYHLFDSTGFPVGEHVSKPHLIGAWANERNLTPISFAKLRQL